MTKALAVLLYVIGLLALLGPQLILTAADRLTSYPMPEFRFHETKR